MRDELWVLAHLFVEPDAQNQSLGRNLLNRAFAYGSTAKAGIISSSPGARAITAYSRLPGFEVHPSVTAEGALRRAGLRVASGVRDGVSGDVEFAADVDRRLRGGAHGPDLDFFLREGDEFLVLPDRGYALAGPSGPSVVAALDVEAASQLLIECLARTTSDDISIKRMAGGHQWAISCAVEAGLVLRPWGPIVCWNCSAPRTAYLQDSAFC